MLHYLLQGDFLETHENCMQKKKNGPHIIIMPNRLYIFISYILMLVECTFQVVKQISNFLFIIRAVDREVLALL